jgi:hypothetical protein
MDPAAAHLGSELRVIAHLDREVIGTVGEVDSATKDKVTLVFADKDPQKHTRRDFAWSAVQPASIPWDQRRAMVAVVDDPKLTAAFNEGAGVAVSTPLVEEVTLEKRSLYDSITYLLREANVDEAEIGVTTVAIMSRFSIWLRDEAKTLGTGMGGTLNAAATVLLQGIKP